MGLFDKIRKNNTQNSIHPNFSDGGLGGLMVQTDIFNNDSIISEDEAMKIPAVASCVELITSSIAQLPISLYKYNDEDDSVEKIKDNRFSVLNDEANETMNSHNLKKRMVKDYLLYGATYNKLEFNEKLGLDAIYNLEAKNVGVSKYTEDGYRFYGTFYLSNNQNTTFFPEEMLISLKDTKDGLTSNGILNTNKDLLEMALNELNYAKAILQNGSVPIGVLEAASKLSQDAITRLKETFTKMYSGAKNTGQTIVLEQGLQYKPIAMKPNELDLTNQKKSTISEIARIFNIPESMINSDANKYGSNEADNITFLQYCLSPIIESFETSLNKSLLLEDEKREGYYFKFETSEIIRTTEKEKIDNTIQALNNGIYTLNEARSKLSLPKFNRDQTMLSLGKVFYNDESGDMIVPNMGIVLDSEGNVKSRPDDNSVEKQPSIDKKDDEIE